MEQLIIGVFAFLTTLVGGILALAKILINRQNKSLDELGEDQDKLVATLKDIVTAQDLRIKQLEEQAEENRQELDTLHKEVNELRALTVQQALVIKKLLSDPARGMN